MLSKLFIGLIATALTVAGLLIGDVVHTVVQRNKNAPKTTTRKLPYFIENIDGCQYILYNNGIAHKGNCTNHALIMLNLPPFPTVPNIKIEAY
jgi:hypothetical protein